MPLSVAPTQPAFPEGLVGQEVLKDYRPEELGGGATLP
jgi:hypothetical protein